MIASKAAAEYPERFNRNNGKWDKMLFEKKFFKALEWDLRK